MEYKAYTTKNGRTRLERRTGRGNHGNEKFLELARQEAEWKKRQTI